MARPWSPICDSRRVDFRQTNSVGSAIGAYVGGLVPVAVLYRAMWFSLLNHNGGGADIGLGMLGLATLVLMPF